MTTREDILKGLIKASTKPDGTMGMDLEELEEMADYLITQPNVDVDPRDGIVRIKKLK